MWVMLSNPTAVREVATVAVDTANVTLTNPTKVLGSTALTKGGLTKEVGA